MHVDILKAKFLVMTLLAYAQALLFGWTSGEAARGSAFASPLACLSRVYFSQYPQMESLLAGYDSLNVPHWDEPTKAAGNFRKNPVVSSAKYCHLSCPWKTQTSRTLFEANKLL